MPGSKETQQILENSGVFQPGADRFLTEHTDSYIPSRPKAFVNWVLFDEQFQYVGTCSGAEQVGEDGVLTPHVRNDLPVEKNGYLYVYVSNETPNIDVFFDNVQVTHIRGALLEETHYYPFGLTMAGISSKAAQGDSYPENKKKYNGIELENDLELQTYNAFFRELDPQTARWWQVDPKTENMEMWSPYTSNYDNPMRYSDPLGDEGEECCWEEFKAFVTLSQAAFQTATAKTVETLGNNFKKRWEAGVTPPQKLVNSEPGEVLSLAGPLAMGENLAATEVSAAKGLLKTEVEAETKALVNTEAKALTKAQQRAEKLSQVERSGKDFTKAGKQAVIDVNKTNNNGQTVCESCVIQTLPAKQSKKGVTPPSNETQVDHIDPKANGGSGTPNNGQVLCRECNLKKGAN